MSVDTEDENRPLTRMNSEKLNDGAAFGAGLVLAVFALGVVATVGSRLAPEETRQIQVVSKDVIKTGGKTSRFIWSVNALNGEKVDVSFETWKSAQVGQPLSITQRKVFNY